MLARKTARNLVYEWAAVKLTEVDLLSVTFDQLLAGHKKVDQALLIDERKRLIGQLMRSHGTKVTLSSVKQDWLTPPYFLDIVRRFGPIALDPCGNPFSFVNAWWTFYGPNHVCGLSNSWWVPNPAVCFVNPPYGRTLHLWAKKMAEEYGVIKRINQGSLIALIPARTGTSYWEQFLWPFADAVCFWHGGHQYPARMCFFGLDGRPADTGATFDAAVIYFGPQRERFRKVFAPYGTVQLVN